MVDLSNVPQYDLSADVDKAIALGIQQGTALGKGIASGKAERQKEIANQLALDKIDKATREGLILPADSGVNSLNDARIDFSNKLVDKLAKPFHVNFTGFFFLFSVSLMIS